MGGRVADPSGFEEYVRARRDALTGAAFLLTGEVHQAEDVVQTALIRAWPRWEKISRVEDVDAYVHRIVVNVFLTGVRRRRWRELLTGPVEPEPVDVAGIDETAAAEARLDLEDRLRALAPRQRAVIVLRYFLDLSEAEAAETLGCSVGTVKSQASKAIRRLREHAAAEVSAAEEGDAR